MSTNIRSQAPISALLAVLSVAFMLAGCNTKSKDQTTGITDANVAQKVEQAHTPAEHRELSSYYEAKAQAARHERATERDIGERYERRWGSDNHPMGSRAGRHFQDLAEGHERTASHYREMADWHRELAQRGEHASTPDE